MPEAPGGPSPAQAPAEYAVHDFSGLNRHVDEAFRRVHLLTWRQRLELARRGAVVFAMVAGALGALAICLAIAYWLALVPPEPPPPPPAPIPPVVVIPPVVQQAPPPAPDKQKTTAPIPPLPPTPPAKPAQPVVYNFSKFAHVDYLAGKVYAVTTGSTYSDSTMTRPSKQFCYMSAFLGDDQPLGRQNIAEKTGEQAVENIEVSPEVAQNMGLTMAEVAHARTLCRWAE